MSRKKFVSKRNHKYLTIIKKQVGKKINQHVFYYTSLIIIISILSVLLMLEKKQNISAITQQIPGDRPTDVSKKNQIVNYKTDFNQTWQGVTTQVERVTITKFGLPEKDLAGKNYEGSLEMAFFVSNKSDKVMMPNLNRSILIIDGEEIEPSSSPSSYELGGELASDTDKKGVVTYYIPKMADPKKISSVGLNWTAYNFEANESKDIEKQYDEKIILQK